MSLDLAYLSIVQGVVMGHAMSGSWLLHSKKWSFYILTNREALVPLG